MNSLPKCSPLDIKIENFVLFQSNYKERLIVLFVFIVFVSVYVAYPELDLLVSKSFFSPEHGFIFNNPNMNFLSKTIMWLGRIILFVVLLVAVKNFLQNGFNQSKQTCVALLILIVGNLVLVPSIKNYWDRGRPVYTTNFGGDVLFSSPLKPINKASNNHSFVSGHAAGGYSLMIFAAFTSHRKRWLRRGILTGFSIGIFRVMQGSHYLSDILFAFFPIWFAMEIVILLHIHFSNPQVIIK